MNDLREEASGLAAPLRYPPARRGDEAELHHGRAVADPYRWLEDPESAESRAWIDAENQLTEGFLSEVPERAAIRARLRALTDYARISAPTLAGGQAFWLRNDGLQEQAVLLTAPVGSREGRLLLDPNTLSGDGTVSLAAWSVSPDGRWLAWATSDGGSDWQVWRIREVATGRDLADTLRWAKFTSATWSADSAGFYYGRYPEPKSPLEQVNLNNQLCYHRRGTDQAEDQLVHADPEQPDWSFSAAVTDDGRYLLISTWAGTDPKNLVTVHRTDSPATPPITLIGSFDAHYSIIDSEGDHLYFFTNLNAPRGRVMAVSLADPAAPRWRPVVAEVEDTLQGASIVGHRLILVYMRHARSEVRVCSLSGEPMGEVALPGIGTAEGFQGRADDPETYFAFHGFLRPASIYRYEVATGVVLPWSVPETPFDAARYVTEQVFVESADGARVPMFIVHKAGIPRDGSHPTLLYGYGGFHISLTPSFSVERAVWLEMGGIWAVANLRGGGEYGAAWHDAGRLRNKTNTFADFEAAAEWLIREGYTRPARLAIHGGSNGGLLVGACMTRRPELFGAALPSVAVLDMLRYHRFTIGWAWASDYGRADDPEMFEHLFGYSPLHNLREGVAYPATLVTTGSHDDRVVPAHSFKFAAALQHIHAALPAAPPALIRIETRAGHGAGKSTSQRIQEAADRWSFLVRALDFQPALGPAASPTEAPPPI